jgi:hypothetical protein
VTRPPVSNETSGGSISSVGRFPLAALTAIAVTVGLAFSGCGSSSTTTVDPVARAADVTAQVPGYRLAATTTVTTPAGPVTVAMNGQFDRATRSGELTSAETVAGHHLAITEVFSGLTFYLRAAGLPQLTRFTGGKPWLKFDMSQMLGAMGLGSLPTGTDPSQFLDYLRAVSASTKRVGSAAVRGVNTTHYHAVIDLSRYFNLVAPSQRAAAERSISTLEAALGGHMMPIDAWIDGRNLVRRMGFSLQECVANQKLNLGMTMDFYDYGLQPPTRLPNAAEAYDITPLLSSALGRLKFGCSSA